MAASDSIQRAKGRTRRTRQDRILALQLELADRSANARAQSLRARVVNLALKSRILGRPLGA